MSAAFRTILAILATVPICGCTLAAWGITELTSRNHFVGTSRAYAKPMDAVVSSVEDSLRAIGVQGVQKEDTEKRVYLVGQTRVGEKVRVQVVAKEGVTQVTYRQGAFEDEVAALAFFKRLDSELPTPMIQPVENDPPINVTIDKVESLDSSPGGIVHPPE